MLDKLKQFKTKFYNSTPSLADALLIRNYGKAPVFNPQHQVQGITYKAIDKFGLMLSVYEPTLSRPGAKDPLTDHPLLTLFNTPNPSCHSASDFIYMYGMLFDIYGETFWYLARGENTNKIKEMYLLPPDRVELKVENGELIGYVLHKLNGQQIPFTPDEIYHDKRPNPFNEWRGMSVLERAALYVDTEITTTQFTLNYIRNSGSPSSIVSLPTMDREVFKQFTQEWRENYEGPQNAGKTAFIRGEQAKFQAVGATLKDIDQKVTREMAKEDVLIMLDTPKEILGWSNDSGFGRNTVEAFDYVYAKNKVEPMMRRLDRILEFIGKDMEGGRALDVTHVSPIPEDKEFKLERLKTGTNVWLTIDEARAEEGLDPLPNGQGAKLIPRTTQQQIDTQTKSKIIKVTKKSSPSKAEVAKKLNQDQEQFRSKLVETNDIYANKFKTKMSSFVSTQEKKVLENIDTSAKAFEDWLFNVKDDSEKMAEVLVPVIIDLMEAQSEDVANFITGELMTITPEMRSAVDLHIKQIAGVFNTETLKGLEKTIAEGQAQGESIDKIKKRVMSVYNDAKGYRAERIARTESLRASNSTAQESYKQNGYAKVKWFTNPGACEFCQTMAGRVKEIGSNYIQQGDVITGTDGNQLRIEYTDIETPPLHPNCTCSLVPED